MNLPTEYTGLPSNSWTDLQVVHSFTEFEKITAGQLGDSESTDNDSQNHKGGLLLSRAQHWVTFFANWPTDIQLS